MNVRGRNLILIVIFDCDLVVIVAVPFKSIIFLSLMLYLLDNCVVNFNFTPTAYGVVCMRAKNGLADTYDTLNIYHILYKFQITLIKQKRGFTGLLCAGLDVL